jgi:hypothetical protein
VTTADFYLPNNFKLIYASSDVGKEFLSNKLISLSDKLSNELLLHIQETGEDIGLFYKYFKLWNSEYINPPLNKFP